MKLNQTGFDGVTPVGDAFFRIYLPKKMPLCIIAVTRGKITPAQPEITVRHAADRQTEVRSIERERKTKRFLYCLGNVFMVD